MAGFIGLLSYPLGLAYCTTRDRVAKGRMEAHGT